MFAQLWAGIKVDPCSDFCCECFGTGDSQHKEPKAIWGQLQHSLNRKNRNICGFSKGALTAPGCWHWLEQWGWWQLISKCLMSPLSPPASPAMTRPLSVAFPSPAHAQPGASFPPHLPEALLSTPKYYRAIWAESWILFPKITAFQLTKQQLASELFLFYIMPVETLKSISIRFVKNEQNLALSKHN